MKKNAYIFLFIILWITGCIKDDFLDDRVDPILRITTLVDTLEVNTSYQFEKMYLNNVGQEEEVAVNWSSSDEEVLEISASGLGSALKQGEVIVRVIYDNGSLRLKDSLNLVVGQSTSISNDVKSGTIKTTSSYVLEGDFQLSTTPNGLKLSLAENYKASTALPGLYVYLSNNRNSVANAKEIGVVKVFSGAHEYDIPETGISDYSFIVYFCKPFNVKVGEGAL